MQTCGELSLHPESATGCMRCKDGKVSQTKSINWGQVAAIVKKFEAKAVATFIRTSQLHVNSNLVKILDAQAFFAGYRAMKRSLMVIVAVCSTFLSGCGSAPPDMAKQMEKAHKTDFPVKQGVERQSTPEFIAEHAESPRERANYLRELVSDAKFDPKTHVDMLKKYENDPDSEVSGAAKELLAKAQ